MKEKIEFSLAYPARVNHAFYENTLNIIQNLNIGNRGLEDILEAVLTVSALPEIMTPRAISIPRLPAGKSVNLGSIASELSTEFILSLTAPVKGELTVSLAFGEEEKKAFYPLEILPFDSWTGVEEVPELLAAFSTPAHPVVTNLMVRSGELLQEITGSGTFEGYAGGDPNNVLRQVSALYSAVAELGIERIPAPAEYLRSGQRIRLVDELTEKRQGTSLDHTLLFTSLLEAAGLHPVILLLEEQALPGLWLARETFTETINYDVTALTRRAARGMSRIAFFDMPSTGSSRKDFNEALKRGNELLEGSEAFYCSLDLRRARALKIRPLPLRILEQGRYVLKPEDEEEKGLTVIPEEVVMFSEDDHRLKEKLPRQKIWERKLLDLSLRNGLLNYRPDKNGIPLAPHDLSAFSGDLMDGKEFSLDALPDEWAKDEPGEEGQLSRGRKLKDLSREDYVSGRIPVLLEKEDLQEQGLKLVKGARTSLEETGAGSLYLALGLLVWYSKDDPKTPRLAPLVLLPVEIETRGHLAGLTLRTREEEGHFNITLKEMLKNEFGIHLSELDPLPEVGDRLDLVKIFSKVRSAVLRQKNWDVLEKAHLGLFSFSSFILWNDLSRNLEEFRKNRIVDSLVEGKLTFAPEGLDLQEQFLDDVAENRDIIYPVSSDTSQALAVLGAVKGRSFVLHGPPGTGKSQTITNIIANALMNDRRVLFVAQKMAALEVVEKRLESIGIGSFCLQLHSSRSRKKAVLDQLEASMKIQRIPKNRSFEEEKERVLEEKRQLNEVVKRLYFKDGSGYSIYDLITENARLKDFHKQIDLGDDFRAENLKGKEEALIRLSRMGRHAGGPYRHPLRCIGRVSYHPMMKEEIRAAESLDLNGLGTALGKILEGASLEGPRTFQEARGLAEELRAVLDLSSQSRRSVSFEDLKEASLGLSALERELRSHIEHREAVLGVFLPEVFSEDPHALLRDFQAFESQNLLGRVFRKNPVEKKLALYSREGSLEKTKIPALLSGLAAFLRERTAIYEAAERLSVILQDAQGALTAEFVSRRKEVVDKALELTGSKERFESLMAIVIREEMPGLLAGFEKLLAREEEGIRSFLDLISFQEEELDGHGLNYFESLKENLGEISHSLDLLRDWLIYQETRASAHGEGLKAIADCYHEGFVSDQELLPAFKKSLVLKELRRRLAGEEILLELTGKSLEEKAGSLQELLERLEILERRELYFHLASKVPGMVLDKEASRELAVLQKALRSGARKLSIRNLFAETPTLLGRIAPCMLMSPMSVAQYLTPRADLFDLVIFDEASQIPTAEAIGALGRAKVAIIVGDPRQLPPTSFFQAQGGGEDDEDGELDSILDDSLALSLPESHLLWHYRSRHESLIAFSNRNFYDGELFTYPSPDDLISRVCLVPTGGVYERGGARVNRTEAAAVVREVEKRLKDRRSGTETLGIVTFSLVQQNLIEELLREKTTLDPEMEMALQVLPEPLFIKNLENVQGDERDVIIFSVGYGPDEMGRLTMSFGPLNQEGGWRRLNVAVTRARREMMVFTSINPATFHVSDAQPRGVRDLKAFLDFAEKGSRTVSLEDLRREEAEENLNHIIADRLRERGWRVETSVGTSRFKVDLGVLDPDGSDRFILGIMCGGASYREARAAYDREILQTSVLKDLGWEIHRIYAVDWLENEALETDRIEKVLKELLSRDRGGETSKQGEGRPPGEAWNEERNGNAGGERPYRRHEVKAAPLTLNEFLKAGNAAPISQDLLAIVEAEGPISESLLTKRAVRLYGLPRTSEKMESQVEQILSRLGPKMTGTLRKHIYWGEGQDPQTWSAYRKTDPRDEDRLLTDIAEEEILACLRDIAGPDLTERALIRRISEALGYPGLNVDNERFLQKILDLAQHQGILQKDDKGLLFLT